MPEYPAPTQAEIDREASYWLMRAAAILAPTGKEQEAFSKLGYRTPPEDRVIALLSAMLDGRQHGNWPTA